MMCISLHNVFYASAEFQREGLLSYFLISECCKHSRYFLTLRDWSLITGRGEEATKREEGVHVKFNPYGKAGGGGGGGVLAMLKWGHKKC